MRRIFAEYNPQCNSIDVYTTSPRPMFPLSLLGRLKEIKYTTPLQLFL